MIVRSLKPWLIKRIAWRLQSLAEGDLSYRALGRAADLANDADGGVSHTEKITVRNITDEKYDRIVACKLGPMPEPMPLHEAMGYDEDDIPF